MSQIVVDCALFEVGILPDQRTIHEQDVSVRSSNQGALVMCSLFLLESLAPLFGIPRQPPLKFRPLTRATLEGLW
jgi:hypothetical protein